MIVEDSDRSNNSLQINVLQTLNGFIVIEIFDVKIVINLMEYTSRHDGTIFFHPIFMIGSYMGETQKKYLIDIPETKKWGIPVSYSAG